MAVTLLDSLRDRSSVGLERRPVTAEVAGSSPVGPAIVKENFITSSPAKREISFISFSFPLPHKSVICSDGAYLFFFLAKPKARTLGSLICTEQREDANASSKARAPRRSLISTYS